MPRVGLASILAPLAARGGGINPPPESFTCPFSCGPLKGRHSGPPEAASPHASAKLGAHRARPCRPRNFGARLRACAGILRGRSASTFWKSIERERQKLRTRRRVRQDANRVVSCLILTGRDLAYQTTGDRHTGQGPGVLGEKQDLHNGLQPLESGSRCYAIRSTIRTAGGSTCFLGLETRYLSWGTHAMHVRTRYPTCHPRHG